MRCCHFCHFAGKSWQRHWCCPDPEEVRGRSSGSWTFRIPRCQPKSLPSVVTSSRISSGSRAPPNAQHGRRPRHCPVKSAAHHLYAKPADARNIQNTIEINRIHRSFNPWSTHVHNLYTLQIVHLHLTWNSMNPSFHLADLASYGFP